MSSNEQEPSAKKRKMDPASEDISSPILKPTDTAVEVPTEPFSILTAMMNTVPDVLVDNVLSDVDFRDIFTFKSVSHRCHDIVLSNLNRLKKPAEIAVRILWARNTKSLMLGSNAALHKSEQNTFVVSPPLDGQRNVDPAGSWREDSMLLVEYLDRFTGEKFTEVRSIGGKEEDAIAFLLKKLFLPHMLVSELSVKQLDKKDFAMLAEVLETHGATTDMRITVNNSQHYDFERSFRPTYIRNFKRSLCFEDILPLLNNERIASISVENFLNYPAIPKDFFMSSCLKSITRISLNAFPNALAAKFDNEMLLSTFPQLNYLCLGECDVTAAGLNTLLKQYIAGARDFESVELTLRLANEWVDKKALWAELVDGIQWPDYTKKFSADEDSGHNDRGLGMFFQDSTRSRSRGAVWFFTKKANFWQNGLSIA